MDGDSFGAILWLTIVVVVGVLLGRPRRERDRMDAGTARAVREWLSVENRRAVEIAVRQRAGAHLEELEGNLREVDHSKPAACRSSRTLLLL